MKKLNKINSTKMRKVGAVALWIILIFIFVRGVYSIVTGSSIAKQKAELHGYMASMTSEESEKTEAMAFAENFVTEYMTFTGESGSDYAARIEKYTAKDLSIKEPEQGSVSTVKTAKAVAYESKDGQINVTVLAQVIYGNGSGTKELTIKVPIGTENGLYAVNEYPQFVPPNQTADIDMAKGYSGDQVSDAQKKIIQPYFESFLKAYYEGNESDLKYYITSEFPTQRGLEGAVKFTKIDTVTIYASEDGTYIIDANILVNDGREIRQHLFVTAEKSGDTYMMKSLKTTA